MNTKTKLIRLIFIFSTLVSNTLFGRVQLPELISDGMVLQRDTDVKIWGWASDSEKITIHFNQSTYQTMANKNGEWELTLSGLKAGGPYNMQIDASNSITIHNIVIGDVWICSGQSNMGVPLGWLSNVYKDDIEKSENPFIRQFMAPWEISFIECKKNFKLSGWQSANPENTHNFTAVGYFFAQKIYEAYKVPIGLITAAMGGSSTEAWISEEAIKTFPKYYEDAQRYKNPGFLEQVNMLEDKRISKWNKLLRQNDEGYKNPELTWRDPKLNTSDWETMQVPGYWADTKLGYINGVVWFRKNFNILSDMVNKPATLKLGRIVDIDSVFINGQFVGTMGSQYAQRIYTIPKDLLIEGENTIVVRVVNNIRKGGFVPGKQYEISVDEKIIDLKGEWAYRLGATVDQLEEHLFTGKISTGLFNGMIAPMLNYRIKGVLWYQGESNTSRAFEQYDLFKLLIKDWRHQWQQGDFPFLFVQLPNFVEVNFETTQYDWAYFRESQLKALSIPNTGMAVTIDIGEWNDIHPVNKKDAGYRLAYAAQKVAYGEKRIVYSGPIYQSMKINGNKIILTFANIGSGLISQNGGELKCFEICGVNNVFFLAQAKIEKDKIIVWSDEVAKPVAVRYAWANNPEGANLYNREGLPASPFRTSELY
jgi:sialate O-acetylesterase